jgi:hypothetical protein
MARPESYPVVFTDPNQDCIFFKVGRRRPLTRSPIVEEKDFSWKNIYTLEIEDDTYIIEKIHMDLCDMWEFQTDGLVEFSNLNIRTRKPEMQQACIVGFTHVPSPDPDGTDTLTLFVEMDGTMLHPISKKKA